MSQGNFSKTIFSKNLTHNYPEISSLAKSRTERVKYYPSCYLRIIFYGCCNGSTTKVGSIFGEPVSPASFICIVKQSTLSLSIISF